MSAPKGNKFALGCSTSGSPPFFKNEEELKQKCIEYFESTDKYTITGLTLYLGFMSRTSLEDYSKKSDYYLYIIKRAKLVVENGYEKMFHEGSNAGIFPLKNMGWKDRTEIEQKLYDMPLTDEELKKAKDRLEEDY